MSRFTPIIAGLLLSACGTTVVREPIEVLVQVPVPCDIRVPPLPEAPGVTDHFGLAEGAVLEMKALRDALRLVQAQALACAR
jgi:hypothetical protein